MTTPRRRFVLRDRRRSGSERRAQRQDGTQPQPLRPSRTRASRTAARRAQRCVAARPRVPARGAAGPLARSSEPAHRRSRPSWQTRDTISGFALARPSRSTARTDGIPRCRPCTASFSPWAQGSRRDEGFRPSRVSTCTRFLAAVLELRPNAEIDGNASVLASLLRSVPGR